MWQYQGHHVRKYTQKWYNVHMDSYQKTIPQLYTYLSTNENGLPETEVTKRQLSIGKNVIHIEKDVSFLKLVLHQFNNYLAWLLIFIAAFAFFSGFYFHLNEQIIDGTIITIIVVLNVFIGAYQDYKSEKTAQLLKSVLKNEAIVMRHGVRYTVNAEELVPGDIIFLEEGDKIPADCRLVASNELKINESMLTGESTHVFKDIRTLKKTLPLAERKNMVYMNTYVVNGSATCVVIGTGKQTEIGTIAQSFEGTDAPSPFVDEVDSASKKITYVAIALILIVLGIFFVKGNDWISIFMIGSALVIGSIPEGLPAIVTFSLAIGSLRLAKKHVLVKTKSLLETLGSVDVLCTDKTGTLTENMMTVKKLFFEMQEHTSVDELSPLSYTMFTNCALLVNEAKDTVKGLHGEAEDIALIQFFQTLGVDIRKVKAAHDTISFAPFSSERKYASSLNTIDGKYINFRKGAPEIILEECDTIIEHGKIKKISKKDRTTILAALKQCSDNALRSIAFSYAPTSHNAKKAKEQDHHTFIGFVGIYDAPKEGVQKTIKAMYNAGIEVKMITGDNVYTATAIAKECGFQHIEAVTWEELKNLSPTALQEKVNTCNVFARMSPEFKLKIVEALQETGRRVAITGDGVNDVPALKKAEVGIAMGKKGTDIAKEAADLILLDDNLFSILAGIKEGRTIFSNVRKIINYLLTANIAEVFVVFLGSMFGVTPFLAIQLLWVNFVTDIAPAMALGSDPSHKDIMKKKPTGKHEKLINKKITLLTIFIGLKKVIIMFGLFFVIYRTTNNLELAQTVSFTWLVSSHFVRIASIRFDEHMPIFSNPYVNWAITIPVILQIIIIYTPLSLFFQVVPLSLAMWGIILITVVAAVLLAKVITAIIDAHIPLEESDY
ncbi:MAG: hypothetical protein COX82_02460 [Candidatus Magasanikbacteria bacterium CG_4_10_14_0_2_um_filter_41_10]|uniref:Cation-transporting P-type ATPase N-terminal domain-containing protein n=1 Tax=Candidatus Magasanikbacteria bacterium CG_4_10_14_0_2_um_filter_41_10 TaxID=1974638 RepID=A0A2M7V4M7_9BACT|nr:MAG: hypothetical protein COX82_02460 [Candidatus Magasanikbacteria bacterium CG_4_10_14_0_2_um_filter_41_10]